MAPETFEGNMLIVQLLDVTPITQSELKGFQNPFLEVDLYTDVRTGVLFPFSPRCPENDRACFLYQLGSFSPRDEGEDGGARPKPGHRKYLLQD